jgi:uncharacterized iron-regulated membrane protein
MRDTEWCPQLRLAGATSLTQADENDMKIAAVIFQRLPSARKIWLNIHLWLGLTAGFVLALIGLTGSLLVLNGPLQQMELGYRVEGPPTVRADIDAWIAAAQRSYPEIGAIDNVIGPGFAQGGSKVANLGFQGSDGRSLTIIVNPSSGLPLSKFHWGDTYTAEILKFHTRLSSPTVWAREAIAWLAVVMLVSLVTGLYLWWPRNRNWRVAFTLKRGARGRRRLLDLHNLFAVYLYVPLFILAFTGVYFIKPHWIEPAVWFLPEPRTVDATSLPRSSEPGACDARTSPGQAVDLAKARFPAAKFVLMMIPKQPERPYHVQLAPPNNIDVKGQTTVLVDRECPVILTAVDGSAPMAMETFRAVMFPLHVNLMLGTFGSVIVFLAGLILPVSFVTGVLLWLDKRKNRRRAQSA